MRRCMLVCMCLGVKGTFILFSLTNLSFKSVQSTTKEALEDDNVGGGEGKVREGARGQRRSCVAKVKKQGLHATHACCKHQ